MEIMIRRQPSAALLTLFFVLFTCAFLGAAPELTALDDGLAPAPDHPDQPGPADPAGPPEDPADEPLGDPAPIVTPTAKDYLPLLEMRVDRCDDSLKDLQAFLNHAAPVATAEVSAVLTESLTHLPNLKAIDQTRPLIGLVALPKQVFTLRPGNLAQPPDAYQPLRIELIPIAGEKEYLERLGEEVDEIRQDGAYKTVNLKHHWKPLFLQFAPGYVVFCEEKIGVDVGVAYVASLPPPPAAPPADAVVEKTVHTTARIVFPVRRLLASAGLQEAAQRQQFLHTVAIAWSRSVKQMTRMMRRGGANQENPFSTDPAQLQTALEQVLATAEELESVEAAVLLDAQHAELRFMLEARPDTPLAKTLAELPAAEPTKIAGLEGVDPVFFMDGGYDALQLRLVKLLAPMYAKRMQAMMQMALKYGEKLDGARYRLMLGIDKTGEMRGAADVQLPKDTTAVELLADVGQRAEAAIAEFTQPPAEGEPPAPLNLALKVAPAKEQDGWQVFDWQYTFGPRGADGAINPADQTRIGLQLACQGQRVLYCFGTGTHVGADRLDYAAGKSPLGIDPARVKALAERAQEKHAVLVAGFQPYPWIRKTMRELVGDAQLEKVAADTIAKAQPLTIEAFSRDRRLETVVSLDAEAIKLYMAFGIAMRNTFAGNQQPPANQGPPGGAEEGF